MNDTKEIITPIGKGTVIGLSFDHAEILVMHTRPKEQRDKTHGATFIHWWPWDDEKGEIVDDGERPNQPTTDNVFD